MSNEAPLNVVVQAEGDNLIVANPVRLRPWSEESTGLGLKNSTKQLARRDQYPGRSI